MSVKNWLRSWFRFGSKDRLGLLALALLVLATWLLPHYFHREPAPPRPLPPALVAAFDSFAHEADKAPTAPRRDPGQHAFAPPKERFPFDPNTLDEAGWVRLGLRARTAATIVKYRSKGGRFRHPEDLQKIWGLPSGFYESVRPFIRLESPSAPGYPSYPASRPANRSFESKKPVAVGINTADTSAWIALPGIGSKLAARIVAFREKLGGFVSIEQVAETYGLRDSTFQLVRGFLRLDGAVRPIDLNTATLEQLREHPYIRWNGARAIIAYRQQHGKFASVADLRKINLFDEAAVQKLLPYLRLGEVD